MQEVVGDGGRNRRWSVAAVLFCAAALVVLYRDDVGGRGVSHILQSVDTEGEDARLEKVLRAAAMVDKTVILTAVGAAWARPDSVLDLFLESFRAGHWTRRLLRHLVIVTLDRPSHARCLAVHPHCFALAVDGADISGGEDTASTAGVDPKMAWWRTELFLRILENGYDFIYTDSDVLWLRDPSPRFIPDGDLQLASEHYVGSSYKLTNKPDLGFMYARSNNRTTQFFKLWLSAAADWPGRSDGDVFDAIKGEVSRAVGLKVRFLDTARFGSLCEPSSDVSEVCTLRASCCRELGPKLGDLRLAVGDWRRFGSLTPTVKGSHTVNWSVPHSCSVVANNQ